MSVPNQTVERPAGETLAEVGLVAPLQNGQLDPVDRGLSYGANNPTTMLSLLLAAKNPEGSATMAELQDELNEAQGAEPGWILNNAGSTLSHYALRHLVWAGFAREETKVGMSGVPALAFGAAESGLEAGVPLFGVLLDMELNLDFSLQQLLGGRVNHAPVPTALARFRLVEYLHSQEGRPVNARDVARNISGLDDSTWIKHINVLESNGVVRVRSKRNPADRQLKLLGMDSAVVEGMRGKVRPEVMAVYGTITALRKQHRLTIDGESLLMEVADRYSHLDISKVWETIVRRPSCLRFVDDNLYGDRDRHQHVTLTDAYAEAVPELVGRVEAIRHSPVYRRMAAKRAMDIVDDPRAVAYLLAKARANISRGASAREQYRLREKKLHAKLVGGTSLKRQLTFDRSWKDGAACTVIGDPDMFFLPDADELPLTQRDVTTHENAARAVCDMCEVSPICLKVAQDRREPHGVWGGLNPTERTKVPPALQAFLNVIVVR
jgi:WhiB family transcriptional regulator, redox-sensing transcriptional regulator